MSCLTYPEIGAYKIPEKNVLVISCIDLRLTDNLLHFLHFDNLHNRYDHFALAGTSLCMHAATIHKDLFKSEVLEKYEGFEHWRKSLDDHLAIAITLHDIRDVYIVEHQNCGAYKAFLEKDDFDEEFKVHSHFARALSEKIHKPNYPEKNPEKEGETYQLNVHCFLSIYGVTSG